MLIISSVLKNFFLLWPHRTETHPKRVTNYQKIEKLIERFGSHKAAKIILNCSSEANLERGVKNKFVGFDVNDIVSKHFGTPNSF